MAIETVYRVRKANGELAGEYMDKKQADNHDQKLDCIYLVMDLIAQKAAGLDEATVESIAEHLIDNKSAVLNALKKVKSDISPTDKVEAKATKSVSNETNVESFDSVQRAVNG